MGPVLQISELAIRHGSEFSLFIDRFSLLPGQCLSISGESGCGKSSFLDVVALMAPPAQVGYFGLAPSRSEGMVDISRRLTPENIGENASLRSSIIGYAPQSGGMLPFLTAQADSGSSARLSTRTPSAWHERQRRFAERLGIANDLKKSRGALSGGQRKRVSLLRALALPRVLLVLDEPTAGLDARRAAIALDLIIEAAQQDGTACLIASHDVTLAESRGFQVCPMDSTFGALEIQ